MSQGIRSDVIFAERGTPGPHASLRHTHMRARSFLGRPCYTLGRWSCCRLFVVLLVCGLFDHVRAVPPGRRAYHLHHPSVMGSMPCVSPRSLLPLSVYLVYPCQAVPVALTFMGCVECSSWCVTYQCHHLSTAGSSLMLARWCMIPPTCLPLCRMGAHTGCAQGVGTLS